MYRPLICSRSRDYWGEQFYLHRMYVWKCKFPNMHRALRVYLHAAHCGTSDSRMGIPYETEMHIRAAFLLDVRSASLKSESSMSAPHRTHIYRKLIYRGFSPIFKRCASRAKRFPPRAIIIFSYFLRAIGFSFARELLCGSGFARLLLREMQIPIISIVTTILIFR